MSCHLREVGRCDVEEAIEGAAAHVRPRLMHQHDGQAARASDAHLSREVVGGGGAGRALVVKRA